MPDTEEADALARLNARLYARGDQSSEHAFTPNSFEALKTPEPVTVNPWQRTPTPPPKPRKKLPLSIVFFIVAAGFFLVALLVAGFLLLHGSRAVSTDNVTISVQGPTAISSGDTVPLLISISNQNAISMTNATITVDFPPDARNADDPTEPLARYTDSLGDIASGESATRTVRGVLFGSENQAVKIPIHIEYHTPGSNSVFVKDKEYDLTITSSPLSVNVTALSQVASGQPVTLAVAVRSNAASAFNNVTLAAEYPFGFVPTKTDPAPSSGSLFMLGTLLPGQEKRVLITGVLSGQQSDVRAFHFTAGTVTDPNAIAIGLGYTEKEADIVITKPFLSATLALDSDSSETPVIHAGVPVSGTVSWINTLPTQIRNAQISVALKGDALDPNSIRTASGFYRSSDQTVLFTQDTSPGLALLQAGDKGAGSFSFSTKALTLLSSARNPTLSLIVSVLGQRIGDGNVADTITSSVTRTVKIATDLGLASRAVHTGGPFTNTGPIPPKANTETTYTVYLDVTNSFNTVADAKVTTTLPSYVTYKGPAPSSATDTANGTLTYSDANRQITWDVGDVAAGTTGTQKEIAFQIGLLPSVSQEGTSPVLVFAQQVSGVDRFTQKAVSGSAAPITTQITSEPKYTPSMSVVTK